MLYAQFQLEDEKLAQKLIYRLKSLMFFHILSYNPTKHHTIYSTNPSHLA